MGSRVNLTAAVLALTVTATCATLTPANASSASVVPQVVVPQVSARSSTTIPEGVSVWRQGRTFLVIKRHGPKIRWSNHDSIYEPAWCFKGVVRKSVASGWVLTVAPDPHYSSFMLSRSSRTLRLRETHGYTTKYHRSSMAAGRKTAPRFAEEAAYCMKWNGQAIHPGM